MSNRQVHDAEVAERMANILLRGQSVRSWPCEGCPYEGECELAYTDDLEGRDRETLLCYLGEE